MPRPSQINEKRKELLPIVARTFAELGYRRATTAELAKRCGVRENILYRLWPGKQDMFIAAIDFVYQQAADTWQAVLSQPDDGRSAAVRLLEHEARHYGESGLHRIIFAGLSETDEPEVKKALRAMYRRFHRFVRNQITEHRNGHAPKDGLDEATTAWAIVALGNVANVGRELGLLTGKDRQRLFGDVGRRLLDGR